jgi:hypothetical protein
MKQGAIFDSSGCYRYSLWREWDGAAPKVGFVMLNPSRADAKVNDPTICRCLGLARAWGYGALEVVNLFAYRTAYPDELKRVDDPIGHANDEHLASLGDRVSQIVLAWGNWGRLMQRDRVVLPLFAQQSRLRCLGMTKLGQPRHPLYLAKTTPLVVFTLPLVNAAADR